MTPTDLEILKDALHVLRTYRRNAPPDLKPYGRHGHPADTVISNLELVIQKHEDTMKISTENMEVGYCEKCKEPHHLVNKLCWECRKEIPQLRPVTRRCVTLDKEAWR